MITAATALQRLQEGNARFMANTRTRSASTDSEQRRALTAGQEPFAIIIACADSRVPVEIIFDQGPGDLFVIRGAGNIVTTTQIGSVEFAAAKLGVRLAVVLGHTHCGAVQAALEAGEEPAESQEQAPNLQRIVDQIRQAIASVVAAAPVPDRLALLTPAVRANVRAAADQLSHGSPLLQRMIANGELQIVRGLYSLENGVVEFSVDKNKEM